MKTFFLLFVFIFCIELLSYSQTVETSADTAKKEVKTLDKFIDLAIGYVPKSDLSAIKASIGVNNILWKRFGAYTSVEFGENDYFTNIIGITGSISNSIYLFGGMDFITDKVGLISNGGFNGTRKDIGIGILPYKWTEIKLGWSSAVGTTIEVGVKIPLN